MAKKSADTATTETTGPVDLPILYTSVIPLFNPDQGILVHETPRELKIDNWWDCQLKAGILKRVQ